MDNLSIVISEHNEGKEFVQKMISQIQALPTSSEAIFVTSKSSFEFEQEYGTVPENFRIIANIYSTGAAINKGGIVAKGKYILFVDCHVCFTEKDVELLRSTLIQYPNVIVSPGIYPVNFPDCTPVGSTGYGAAFWFEKFPFEWRWLPPKSLTHIYTVPFISGCAFMIGTDTFDMLQKYGGFLSDMTGILWDEEASMRLCRLGYPTFINPKAKMGHMFIGSPSRPNQSTRNYDDSNLVKVIGAYINVFDENLWDHISKQCIDSWGRSTWERYLSIAVSKYSWIKNKLLPYKLAVDENWFFRK